MIGGTIVTSNENHSVAPTLEHIAVKPPCPHESAPMTHQLAANRTPQHSSDITDLLSSGLDTELPPGSSAQCRALVKQHRRQNQIQCVTNTNNQPCESNTTESIDWLGESPLCLPGAVNTLMFTALIKWRPRDCWNPMLTETPRSTPTRPVACSMLNQRTLRALVSVIVMTRIGPIIEWLDTYIWRYIYYIYTGCLYHSDNS